MQKAMGGSELKRVYVFFKTKLDIIVFCFDFLI